MIAHVIEEHSVFQAIIGRLGGVRLIGVRYTAGDCGGDRGEAPPVYSNENAVELRADIELFFENGVSLVIQWAMDGFDYGLSLKIEEGRIRVDSGESWYGVWGKLLGGKLTGARSSWLRPSNSSALALWSVTLEFESGGIVTIALGRIENDESVDFCPDAIVLFFDPAGARMYEVPDSTGNAYGEYGPPRQID